jgi:hypothetical protein
MTRRNLVAAGVLGVAAVGVYVGTTILGGILDPGYSQAARVIDVRPGCTGSAPVAA